MLTLKLRKQLPKIFFFLLFLTGNILMAQTHSEPTLKKNGKFKQKKTKMADHHKKEINRNGHHKVEFKKHSMVENQTFSKKKKKKK